MAAVATMELATPESPMPWRQSLGLGLRTMIGRAYPRLVASNREPDWVIYEVALPLLRIIAFALVYQALGSPQFIGMLVLGGAMLAFWANVLWSMAAQLHWERQSGNLELYLMAPSSMLWILAGMAFGGMLATLTRSIIIVVIGSLIFGVTYQIISAPAVFVVFIVTMVALYGLGSMLASLYLLYNREVWAVQEIIQDPVSFLTGLYFPIRTLGGALGTAASLIPMTLGLDAMRQLLFPHTTISFLPVGVEIAAQVVLMFVFVFGAIWAFAYIEHKAKIEGRLSLKWQ
jgi:ABC-2 type transport system permease protein